jgi:hypothetical protein
MALPPSKFTVNFQVTSDNKVIGTVKDIVPMPVPDDCGGLDHFIDPHVEMSRLVFDLPPCKKCKRPVHGWRRLLFWRVKHRRKCFEEATRKGVLRWVEDIMKREHKSLDEETDEQRNR